MPVLTDLPEALALADPPTIAAEPERYLPSVDEFMRHQVVGTDDRVWIITRLAYLIGEVLVAMVDPNVGHVLPGIQG